MERQDLTSAILVDKTQKQVDDAVNNVRGDFDKQCGELAKKAVKFDSPVTRKPWGTYARIADPDGNVSTLNSED